MNPLLSISQNPNQGFYPIQVLEQISSAKTNGCLVITTHSVEWRFYFSDGQLIYGTNAIEPFERLERHLRRLSHQNTRLTSAVRTQARSLGDPLGSAALRVRGAQSIQQNSVQTADYQAIFWLIQQKYIDTREAILLVQNILKEVLESYLLLKTFTYELISHSPSPFVHLSLSELLQECQDRVQNWQKLAPQIESSYQRPYLLEQGKNSQKLLPNQREKLKKILIGFNFRQLAVLVNQDTLTLAKNLHPLIAEGVITLREPQAPFHQLPKFSANPPPTRTPTLVSSQAQPSNPTIYQTVNKINVVCVDDSPTMLKAIKQFLSYQNIEVYTITDPIKALREIVRLEPKLILLDIGMPNLDGYRLCRLIRNHSLFKETPIIMVTGNTGVLDRAKAKVAGATDYLTKPFSQLELEKMVQRHLPT